MEVKGTDAFSGARWFKSSKSGAAGHCVQAAFLENNGVGVRDSKNPDGPALLFSDPEWAAFVDGVKAGEFDPR